MNISPRKFREAVLQMLYSYDLTDGCTDEVVPMLAKELSLPRALLAKAHDRMTQVTTRLQEIDEILAQTSEEYEFSRIQRVERNVLRLAVFEMLYDEGVPPKVAISEALRLAKKFSSPAAVKFVNGLLDAIFKSNVADADSEDEDEDKHTIYFGNS